MARRGSAIYKFGENPDIDTAAIEDIWDVGGDIPYAAMGSGVALEVVSSSNEDRAAGNGCSKVRIITLDASWVEVSQDVNLGGVTPIALTGTHLRVQRAYGLDVSGTGVTNVGAITIQLTGGGTPVGRILAEFGQTNMAAWTVPDGKTAQICNFSAKLSGKTTANVIVDICTREPGKCWRVRRRASVVGSGSSNFLLPINPPITLVEHSDVRLRGDTDTNNVGVSGSFRCDY